jgi:hypothetical protein
VVNIRSYFNGGIVDADPVVQMLVSAGKELSIAVPACFAVGFLTSFDACKYRLG